MTPKPLSPTARHIIEIYRQGALQRSPSPREVARTLATKPQIVAGLIRHLVAQGHLVALPGGWIVASEAIEEAIAVLRASAEPTLGVGRVKDLLGLTRKLAIPLLEHLDETQVTRREGGVRRLLPPLSEYP